MKEGKFLDIQKVYDNIDSIRLDILSFYILAVMKITYPGGGSKICLPGGTLPWMTVCKAGFKGPHSLLTV